MSIKRKDIKAILPDADDEAVSKLISLIHTEVDTIRDEKDDIQKQLDKANNDLKGANEAKEKAESDLENYKTSQTAKEARAAKEKAVREYYKGNGIQDKSLGLAVRSSAAEIDALELDSNGKIKATKALDDLLAGDLSGLVSTTTTTGVKTANPPAGTSGGSKMTKAEIIAIKDTAARQKAIAENHELFGI